MPKSKKSVKAAKITAPLDNEQLALQGVEFFNKKAAIKELEAQCKDIRKPLEEVVMTSGRETESGSKILVIPFADKEVHLKETLRVSKVLLPEAIEVLHEHGLDECVENVPTVREDVIERLYEAGEISSELLKRIYAEKPSWAFSVNLKDHMDV